VIFILFIIYLINLILVFNPARPSRHYMYFSCRYISGHEAWRANKILKYLQKVEIKHDKRSNMYIKYIWSNNVLLWLVIHLSNLILTNHVLVTLLSRRYTSRRYLSHSLTLNGSSLKLILILYKYIYAIWI